MLRCTMSSSLARKVKSEQTRGESQVPLSPLIEYELAFMATCENRWMELYNFSTYRLILPFVCFSVCARSMWLVVNDENSVGAYKKC